MDLLALGRLDANNSAEPFSMAGCAIRASAYRNAVSRLHRDVSQQMWESVWAELPVSGATVTSPVNPGVPASAVTGTVTGILRSGASMVGVPTLAASLISGLRRIKSGCL